jgi:vancomycin resistance protein YoaR
LGVVDGHHPDEPSGDDRADAASSASPEGGARPGSSPVVASGPEPSGPPDHEDEATADLSNEAPVATAKDRTDGTPPVTPNTPHAPEASSPAPTGTGGVDSPPVPDSGAEPVDDDLIPPAPVISAGAGPGGRPDASPDGGRSNDGDSNDGDSNGGDSDRGGSDSTADDDAGSDQTIVLGGAGAAKAPTPAPRLSPDAVAASAATRPSDAAVRARITPPFGITSVGEGDPSEPAPRHLRASGVTDDQGERRRPVMLMAAAPVLIVVLLILGWAIDSAALSGQVMRNVEVAGRPVGGLGEASLPEVMSEIADEVATREVHIRSGDQTYETTAGAIGLALDEEATAEAALDAGRSDSLITRPFRWLGSFFGSREVPVRYTVSEGAAALTLAQLQGGNALAPAEPTIHYDANTQQFGATPGRNGTGIDVQQVAAELPEAAEASASGPIVIRADVTEVSPQFTDEAATELAQRANDITANGLTVRVDETDVRVEAPQLRTWIGPAPADQGLELAPNGDQIGQDLPALFAQLPGEPQNATVTLAANGRPEVVPARNGVRCCNDDSAQRIWNAVDGGEAQVTLEAQVAEPETTTEEAQQWGIVEPVGGNRAWQNGAAIPGPAPGFTTYHAPGEPRVVNIHRIADLVRGAVIPPDGTFSINDHVGRRTVENGFVEAGAISEGRHVQDVGGGVSQFATTTFNAAYFAGLDIETYQAHSEWFSRYPRGREATMGYPAPDLRIHNNTPYGILIWTSYTDTSLTVTLYSTPYATAEQTGITEAAAGPGCTRVETTRTRSYPNGTTDTDAFAARYRNRPGFDCNNQPIPEESEEEGQAR